MHFHERCFGLNVYLCKYSRGQTNIDLHFVLHIELVKTRLNEKRVQFCRARKTVARNSLYVISRAELKLSRSRAAYDGRPIRQRIDPERHPPSLGIGPVTQVFGINGAQMKIVSRMTSSPTSPEERTRSQRSQSSAELHHDDQAPLDAAGPSTQQPTSSMASSDGVDNKKRGFERLPPDGIDFEQPNTVCALIQQV